MYDRLAKSPQTVDNGVTMKRFLTLFILAALLVAVCGVQAYVPKPSGSYRPGNSKTLVPPDLSGGIICRNDPVNLIDPDGEWARKVTKYTQAMVSLELAHMFACLVECKSLGDMLSLANSWHSGGGEKDYKMKFDYENMIGPGVGDINLQKSPDGDLMRVQYFDVPGFGVLDPAEYGNYLAGWTAAIIEYLTGESLPYAGVVWGGMIFGALPDRDDPAVPESYWDELSSPFYEAGFGAGMNHEGLRINDSSATIYFSGTQISVPKDAIKDGM